MHTFIWKIASRCNLDCDYCYVYKHVDQSWRAQPLTATVASARQLGRRIREHAELHQLHQVAVSLHGGEPLSVGVTRIAELIDAVESETPGIRIRWGMQTNGTLLGPTELEFCNDRKISIGLSIDGPKAANDRHRVDHAGRSSFDATHAALRLLSSSAGRTNWAGVLAVIDLKSDPIETYQFLRTYKPPNIDFLFPLAHHDLRPAGKAAGQEGTPYADWLLQIYKQWIEETPNEIMIRRFKDLITLLAGGAKVSEEWGLGPLDFLVIETNGAIQGVDTLKVTFPGAAELGLNIFSHSIDDVYRAPSIRARQERWAHLSEICQTCELVTVCGGGYIPHRYSAANGFRNPSVYCADIKKLIHEIRGDVDRRLEAAVKRS